MKIRYIILVSGFILLLALCFYSVNQTVMSILSPMPIYLVFLTWISKTAAIITLPVIYLIFSLLLMNRPNFQKILRYLALFLFALSVLYFFLYSDVGIQVQGWAHLLSVIVFNILLYGLIFSILYGIILKKFEHKDILASVAIFVVLAWCGFPYLGEIP